jgi:hypothetical protein
LIQAGADIYETLPDGRSAVDLCDDQDIRTSMITRQDEYVRKQIQMTSTLVQSNHSSNSLVPSNTSLLPMMLTSRPGTLYESRSSVSSPYSSSSSVNRTSLIRRTSIRDQHKVKTLNENFLDILQAKHRIHDDIDESVKCKGDVSLSKRTTQHETTNSLAVVDETSHETGVNATSIRTTKATHMELPAVQVISSLPPVSSEMIADLVSDVKRRREERRRGVGGPKLTSLTSKILPDQPLLISSSTVIDDVHRTKLPDENHTNNIQHYLANYASEKSMISNEHTAVDTHKKRHCCLIL